MQALLSFSRSFHFKLYTSLLSLKVSSSASIFYILHAPENVLHMMIHAISQLVGKLYQYHLEMWGKNTNFRLHSELGNWISREKNVEMFSHNS